MTMLFWVLLSQVALVAGQVFLKRAMSPAERPGKMIARLATGIALLTLWFLVWLGLLQRYDLSYIYPFEGLSPILLVIAASVLLKERVAWQSWVGVMLITAGTVLVGLS